MENNLSVTEPISGHERGLAQDVIWLFKGFVYPCWSREFYKKATERRVIVAIGFLFVFALVLTSITTIRVANAMNNTGDVIGAAYESGNIPTIVIEDGIASVDSQEPYIYSNARQIFAIDTTGSMQEIDTQLYSRGILLTSTALHFVNEDGYRVYPLADLQGLFGNPIVLDKNQVLGLWNQAALGIDLVTFLGVYLWNSVVRLAYIALIGLLVWGILSIMRRRTGFGPILITGIYASVPTLYLVFVVNQIGIHFLGLFSIILVVIWLIAARAVIKVDPAKTT